MPQLGEIKTAKELQVVGTYKYLWCACLDCQKERWVPILRGQPRNPRCSACAKEQRKKQTSSKYSLLASMPAQMGEMRTVLKEHPSGRHFVKLVWDACPGCGRERYVRISRKGITCNNCRTKQGHHWMGGRHKDGSGYIWIWLKSDDFFYPMVRRNRSRAGGYILEHRLVVAKALGRNLQSWEIVHHRHAKYPAGSVEDKQDNRYPENLQLVTDDRHKQITILENRIRLLEQRVLQLEIENIGLKKEIKQD